MKLTPITVFIAFCCAALCAPVFAGAPDLQSDSEVATAGYYRLSWQSDDGGDYLLEESSDPTFATATTLYSGPDTATLISGRADGIYYYRIRNNDQGGEINAWSNVARVEVEHHPLSRAFMFFTLGAIVFVATLTMVVLGTKKHNQ